MTLNKNTPKNDDDFKELILDRLNKMKLEIATLKKQLADRQPFYYPPLPVDYINKCNDGGEHEYPSPWHSITPPHCTKCGKQAPDYKITYSNGTGNVPWNFEEHGGNVINNENPIVTHDSNTQINTNYITDQSKLF